MKVYDIKTLMREKGITQASLAARAGIHPIRLNRVLNGRFRARRSELRRLAAALGIRIVLPRRQTRQHRQINKPGAR